MIHAVKVYLGLNAVVDEVDNKSKDIIENGRDIHHNRWT